MYPLKQPSALSPLRAFVTSVDRLSVHQDNPEVRRRDSQRGFTLTETMMATLIFFICILGVYLVLVRSYQLSALARCRDEARAVLRTYADQFERLQTTTETHGGSYTRWLFFPEGAPSGRGLIWGALSDGNVYDAPLLPTSHLQVSLGASDHPVVAMITRDVSYVSPSTGAVATVQQLQAAGYMLRGTFSISFAMNGKSYSQGLTVLRSVP